MQPPPYPSFISKHKNSPWHNKKIFMCIYVFMYIHIHSLFALYIPDINKTILNVLFWFTWNDGTIYDYNGEKSLLSKRVKSTPKIKWVGWKRKTSHSCAVSITTDAWRFVCMLVKITLKFLAPQTTKQWKKISILRLSERNLVAVRKGLLKQS